MNKHIKYMVPAILLSATGTMNAQNRVPVPVKDTISRVSDLGEVVISSTRNNSHIEDLPMKVEVLGKEDMIEESGIKPGNVASILGDLSVIHIQNTSAVSGNNAIRMQGLDGKYTQLLRDGMPVYEGLSGNFGVLSIPPLDLKQIEIIKGSVSTLYGGGAIAGIINFIAKTPGDKPELTMLVNRSTLKETNVNAYYAEKYGKTGLTLFAGVTTQNATDVNKDGFSDVPRLRQYLLHPRFFWYLSPQTTLVAGYTGTVEKREGGDMQVLDHSPTDVHRYTEINNNERHSIDLQFTRKELGGGTLSVKGVGSFYHLQNNVETFALLGNQASTYGEVSYHKTSGRHDWVAGINNTGEIYHRAKGDSTLLGNYQYNTTGLFVQDGFRITDQLMAEAGLRTDYHNKFGWYVLPRLAFVYKPVEDLSIRLSGGTGYKSPAVFTAQTQTLGYRYLLPLSAGIRSEKSQGINFDGNYHTSIGQVDMTLNQAFYYTHIKDPILPVLQTGGQGMYLLQNMPYAVNSLGTDTYLRFALDHLELYLGYNHTVSRYNNTARTNIAFAPQDKFASTLAYDIEGKWRFGIENSWIGHQYDDNNQATPNYWFWAAMISRQFGEHVTLVLNGENLFDARQGKNAPLFTGTVTHPEFAALWGPVDGRIMNMSLKVNF